jgi:hypothetical protein
MEVFVKDPLQWAYEHFDALADCTNKPFTTDTASTPRTSRPRHPKCGQHRTSRRYSKPPAAMDGVLPRASQSRSPVFGLVAHNAAASRTFSCS